MIQSKKNWSIERPDEALVKLFQEQLELNIVQAKVLVSRGFTTIEEVDAFININENSLHDPFSMYDMEKAVAMIQETIEQGQKIVVYGDYDADGVTSVTVLTTVLEELGADVSFVIPNRFEHGYGPNQALFEEIANDGASLLITVDNGVSGIEEVAYAKSRGLNVIITDHHEFGEVLPEADAILHPRHPQGDYAFPDLAGVGVAFKLATALLGKAPTELLEIVAIGTVADLVPLHGENRYFVKTGIDQLRTSRRPGIKAILSASSTKQQEVTEETIGFSIGPRLNAPGRLKEAAPAVHLLKTESLEEATGLAEQLNNDNIERQSIVSNIMEEAERMIESWYGTEIPAVFVLAKEGWNPGVVGIVASRITDKYYRPTVLLSIDPETGLAKGSARSIRGYHLYNELAKNAELLSGFGGHPVAAGLTLPIENIESLRKNLIQQAEEGLTPEEFIATVGIDVPLMIDDINLASLASLERLRPFGMGFSKPLYLIENIKANSIRKIGAGEKHLKLEVTDGVETLDVVGFNFGELANEMSPGVTFSMIGDLQINEWNGNKKPQMLLEDLSSKEWQLFDLRGIREPGRWIHMIPPHALLVAFQKETLQQAQFARLANDKFVYGEQSLPNRSAVVLLDLPNDQDEIEKVVEEVAPERIYAHFHVLESSYFDTLPTREQFAWYYSFLKSRGQFNLRENGERLAQHKRWKKDLVNFMSNVFSDLEFVKLEDGMIEVLEIKEKRNLTDAFTYKQKQQQMALEQKLLYAPYYELKEWFEQFRESTAREEK